MPTPLQILQDLTALANDWVVLAVAWHVCFGLMLIGLAAGWRPANRLAGWLLSLPLVSVSLLSWLAGNSFNGTVFAALAVTLVSVSSTLPWARVRINSRGRSIFAGALLVFGWTYPHFVRVGWWPEYAYGAPLGLIPCPTLAAVTGVALFFSLLESRACAWLLGVSGAFYGLFGVVRLGVGIDLFLIAGAFAVWETARGIIPHGRRQLDHAA